MARRQFLVLAGLALVGFARSPSIAMAQTAGTEIGDAVAQYRVSAGDILGVKVFGHEDVSGEFEVDAQGNITFPLLGYVKAEGRDVRELQDYIAEELNRDFLVNPRVSVEVLNYRPFFILGQVEEPGSYPFRNGLDVRQAVALAGGYTRRARTSSMTILRVSETGEQLELDAEEGTKILPGDTIEIARRIF